MSDYCKENKIKDFIILENDKTYTLKYFGKVYKSGAVPM